MDVNETAPPSDARAVVLVIDADKSFVKTCRQALEGEGYKIIVSPSGKQGLEAAKAEAPGVVLLDWKAADPSDIAGFDLLDELVDVNSDIVPVVATADATVDAAVEAMKMGVFDFLSKPVSPEKLLETVRQAVGISEMQREAETKEEKADKYDLLLEGLDVLGEAYSIGLEKRQFLDDLARLENVAKSNAASRGEAKTREEAIAEIHDDLLDADAIMWNYDFQKNALIQILLDVQEKFRWLPRHILNWISGRLNIPLKDILVIANFYEAFSTEPRGRHTIQVCTGTACHVRGATETLTRVSAALGIQPGETDAKQRFTLETVHCLGCCALAPVVQIGSQYYRDPSQSQLAKLINSLEGAGGAEEATTGKEA
ncbi:MAG: NAD(P)H-dependent oxidoreductase subunit E [Acidobacteriota bacterium]|jgi:NADH-quinone oxidoreductase subunit E|nr:NAD(P)H-dependent oxidoreductase subunit E [Acidobacteriota bacterium]